MKDVPFTGKSLMHGYLMSACGLDLGPQIEESFGSTAHRTYLSSFSIMSFFKFVFLVFLLFLSFL